MALSLENALAVKQQAFGYVTLSVKAQTELKAFFSYHAQHNKNVDLDFIAFANLTADTAVADAACKVYFIYLKKQATATAAYFKINDHATVAGGASGADMTSCVEMASSGDEVVLVYPGGLAHGTGVAIASQTTPAGNTDSTSGDGPNGFIIIGAA